VTPSLQAASTSSTARNLVLNPFGGNVGIGTTSPLSGSKLDVVGIIASTNTANANNRHFVLNGYSGYTWDIYGGHGGGGYFGISENAGTPYLVVQAGNGYVVIGTTSTSYKFQVYIDASNEGHVTSTGDWARTSDIRFKNNVSDLKGGLDKILKLRPVRYDSKTENTSPKGQGRHTGFIGQELEKVIPGIVSTDSKGYKAIAYGELTTFLTEAIQEQQKQIENLKSEIQNLKAKLSANL